MEAWAIVFFPVKPAAQARTESTPCTPLGLQGEPQYRYVWYAEICISMEPRPWRGNQHMEGPIPLRMWCRLCRWKSTCYNQYGSTKDADHYWDYSVLKLNQVGKRFDCRDSLPPSAAPAHDGLSSDISKSRVAAQRKIISASPLFRRPACSAIGGAASR